MTGDVDVGLDDAATLLEPEPHIPDVPEVSSIPEEVDIAGDVDVPASDGVGTPGIASMPGSTAVAGVEAPGVVPPPSYIVLDPNICEGEVATVEHVVALVVVGMEMVPARPVGAGLTPADVISVEPSGIPVGKLTEPIPMPSGEVAPIVGVGSVSSTCAIAPLQTTNAKKTAAINDNLVVVLLTPASIGFATSSAGARLSDIDQSPGSSVVDVRRLKRFGLPTRFAKFQSQAIAVLLGSPKTLPPETWVAPQIVQLNRGLN